MLHERWPDGACEIIAACHDRNGDAALAHEPQGNLSDERPKRHRAAEHADQQRLEEHELPVAGDKRGRDKSTPEDQRAGNQGNHDAEPVGEPAHQYAADCGTDHRRRE
jgi:hypothetical protein